VEVVKDGAPAARTKKRIEVLAFEKKRLARCALIGIVLADNSGLALGIVGFADPRKQHEVDIRKPECGKNYEIGRLKYLLTGYHIYIGNTGGLVTCAVFLDLRDPRPSSKLDIWVAERDRDHRDMRAAFRVRFAAKPLAEPAILALPKLHAVRVCIGPGGIGNRLWEAVISKFLRCLGEKLRAVVRHKRRQRIILCARVLKGISARLRLPLQISGLARNPGTTGYQMLGRRKSG
jgi:hypothetical protein